MARKSITVLGGGIAGLAAAIALEKTGHDVTILEKAKAFDPIGAGIQLGPNAVRSLQKIGAWDAVRQISSSPPQMDIRSGVTGSILTTVHLGKAFEDRYGQPYRIAHRADLHEALLGVAKSKSAITIKMGQEADAFSLPGPVIAADGIWSPTRKRIFPDSDPVRQDVTIWRAYVDMPKIDGVNFEAVNFWLYPGAHLVHYPVKVRGKLNIVGVTQEPGPKTVFARAASPLRALIDLIPEFTRWTAAIVHPLPYWHKDNVLLIGDAAHGTVPWLAQGGAMSLEDAATLIDTTDPATFYARRAARCQRLHEQTIATGKLYHVSGIKGVVRDLVLRYRSQEKLIERNGWIYRGP